MFFILVLTIVVWIRQEWQILGNSELTEAMQTKWQIIYTLQWEQLRTFRQPVHQSRDFPPIPLVYLP